MPSYLPAQLSSYGYMIENGEYYVVCTFEESLWLVIYASIGAFYLPFIGIVVCYAFITLYLLKRMKKKTRMKQKEHIEMRQAENKNGATQV